MAGTRTEGQERAEEPERADGPRRRWRRRLIVAGVVVLVLVVLFHLVGGWYFSGVLDGEALDADARLDANVPDPDIEVVAASNGTVTLRRPSGGGRLDRVGTWGLRSIDGAGTVGEVVGSDDDTVTRRYTHIVGSEPVVGTLVELDTDTWPVDPEVGLGIAFEDVEVEGPLGSLPAWYVPGDGDTWAIVVHGNGMDRRDGLRVLPTLVDAGMPTLLVSVRNDPGAPRDPSGRLRYGAVEWEDLEAAVAYAEEQGASQVVLVGESMGGGIVLTFLEESDRADLVVGLVLDAPMVDFRAAIEHQAADESLPVIGLPLPPTLTSTALWLSSLRFDLDWSMLDHVPEAASIAVPVLIQHGDADGDVPLASSERFAAANPEHVTLVVVPGAGHVESWNVDPDAYEQRVADFLDGVLAAPG